MRKYGIGNFLNKKEDVAFKKYTKIYSGIKHEAYHRLTGMKKFMKDCYSSRMKVQQIINSAL